MQNFPILRWIWNHMNSGKHWIAIASKTITVQYGSSTVLHQMNDQSNQQCKFLCVHTALCGTTEHWQIRGVIPKLGSVKGLKHHCLQCKRQFTKSGQISELHIFAPPNAAPCTVPPGVHAPSPPSRRHCWWQWQLRSTILMLMRLCLTPIQSCYNDIKWEVNTAIL